MSAAVMNQASEEGKQCHFNPYESNGGSIISVAGKDFSVIASDSRLSEGYSILSRTQPHLYQLQPNCVVGCVGFHGDCLTFTKTLEIRLRMYEHEHNKKASTPAIAQLVSTMLYNRRFFPFYVNTVVAGNNGSNSVFFLTLEIYQLIYKHFFTNSN